MYPPDHEPKIWFLDTGYLYTLEEFEEQYPDSDLLPEFRARVMYYRANKEAIEAKYRAEYEAEQKYNSWKNISIEGFVEYSMKLLEKLHYLFELFEGYDNSKARRIDEVIVSGNNAVSRGVCGDNSRETRERFISFIENAEALLNAQA